MNISLKLLLSLLLISVVSVNSYSQNDTTKIKRIDNETNQTKSTNQLKAKSLNTKANPNSQIDLTIDKKLNTAAINKNLNENKENQNQVASKNTLFQTINLNYMYVKYVIDSWILDYNRVKQLSILNKLLNDTLYFIKFVAWISGFLIILFLIYITIKTPTCKDEIMCEMDKVLKIQKRYNLTKKESETMQEFLLRVDRKSTRLNSSHVKRYRMPSSA